MLSKLFRPSAPAIRHKVRSRRFEVLERRDVMSYVFQIGGAGHDNAQESTVDSAGNVYVAGVFEGTVDFDPSLDGSELTNSGSSYVAKYSATATLEWARDFPASGKKTHFNSPLASIWDIAVDATGTYVTGAFNQTVEFGQGTVTSAGGADIFIVKLDSGTGQTVWARHVGGKEGDVGRSIAVADGYVYVTGDFIGTADFDPGPGVNNLTSTKLKNSPSRDPFILKLDAANGNYVHAWNFGGTSTERGDEILVDGNALFVSGIFHGTADFDPSGDTVTRISEVRDRYVASYAATGELIWVQSFESPQYSYELTGFHLAADAAHLYVAGEVKESVVDLDPSDSVFSLDASETRKSFVARYSKDTGLLDPQFLPREFGGNATSDSVWLEQLILDADGGIYFGAHYSGSVDVDPGPGVVSPPSSGAGVVKLDAGGSFLNFWHADASWAAPAGVIADTLLVTGAFSGTVDFPTGDSLTSSGGSDIYILAFDQTPVASDSTALASATWEAPAPAALVESRVSHVFTDLAADAISSRSKTDSQIEPSSLHRRVQAARLAAIEAWSSERGPAHPRRRLAVVDWAVERLIEAGDEAWDAALETLV